MSLFQRNLTAPSSVDPAVRRYNAARTDLLWALIFTVVNIVLGFVGADVYFLFSLAIPYYNAFSGYLSDLIIAVVVFAAFLLCYIFSKKRTGWMVAALVLFVLDCLYLGYVILSLVLLTDVTFLSSIPDIIIHIVVLVCLILGVTSIKKYKASLAGKAFPDDPADGEPAAIDDPEFSDPQPEQAESSDPQPPTDTF